MFYRLNDQGNAVIFENDGRAATRIDAGVFPLGSHLSARHEHPEGIVLTVVDAEGLGLRPEDAIDDNEAVNEAAQRYTEREALDLMTVEELRGLQARRYRDSEERRGKLRFIARILGRRLNDRYGPKYELRDGTTVVYVDDWGNYMTVESEARMVVNTHPTEQFYIPGAWEAILNLYDDAAHREKERRATAAQTEREAILRRLV